MIKWINSYRFHIFGWIAFAVYEVSSLLVVTGTVGNFESYLLHYLINILLFYAHSAMLFSHSSGTGKKSFLILMLPLIILEIIIYLSVSYLVDFLLGSRVNAYFGKSGMQWPFLFSSAWRAIYFMGFATTYYLFLRFRKSKEKEAALQKLAMGKELSEKRLALELADAKNAYLRAQINPHFLMNTLSFIYNKTHHSEPHSSQAVFYLSKVLRYIIDADRGPEFTAIGPEIEQVDNLFQLCRIKDENVFVNILYPDEIETVKVIPMVILSLAENMIKHGNLSKKEFPGEIKLSQGDSTIKITTVNLINTGINDHGHHSGLGNISQRLRHTYGNSASLTHEKTGGNYFRIEVIVPACLISEKEVFPSTLAVVKP